MAHHQAGSLSQAEEGYRQILQSAPRFAEAWHLLDALALQLDNDPLAAEPLRDVHRRRSIIATWQQPVFSFLVVSSQCGYCRSLAFATLFPAFRGKIRPHHTRNAAAPAQRLMPARAVAVGQTNSPSNGKRRTSQVHRVGPQRAHYLVHKSCAGLGTRICL